jgi:myo-inositol 2-dehydrogenase/D-chiro-inositol 1-dehydrogenase
MGDLVRVGVVGAGMIAGCHVRAFSATPGVEVVGVADPRRHKAEDLAATVGAAPCAGLEDILGLDVDVVSVCTPPRTHADLAVRAVGSGRHVFCEKPLATDLEDARRIVRAAEASDRVVMVGHVSRFEPEHRAAKELVEGGYVGEVAMMVHSMTTSFPGWSEGGWLGRPEESGGPLLDLAVHSFDYLAWMVGSPATRVHAVAADSPAGPATYAVATVRYANGAMGQVEVSWAHPAARGFKVVVEVTGRAGRISWDYDSIMGGAIHAGDGAVTWLDPLGERGYAREVAAFVEAVRSGGPSPVPVREAYEAARTALGAVRSVHTGGPVDLTTWEVL